MCGVRNDFCSRKHKYARTSHGMASESLSRGVDLFFAQEFCFLKQEHGPPRGSKQAKTDVLMTTVLGSLCCTVCLCWLGLWSGGIIRLLGARVLFIGSILPAHQGNFQTYQINFAW